MFDGRVISSVADKAQPLPRPEYEHPTFLPSLFLPEEAVCLLGRQLEASSIFQLLLPVMTRFCDAMTRL